LPESERPLLVGDHTAWPRLGARTLEDRAFQRMFTLGSVPQNGQKPQ
jgi:hypothetical protein